MHTRSTSSAQPQALARFARSAEAAQGAIQHQADLLDAALSRYLATCTEYRTAGAADLPAAIYGLGRRLTELQIWVAEVGAQFAAADTGAIRHPPPGRPPSMRPALRLLFGTGVPLVATMVIDRYVPFYGEGTAAIEHLIWNWAALQLLQSLTLLEGASEVGGLGGTICVAPLAMPGLLAGGFTITGMIVVGQWPRWFTEPVEEDDLLNLLHHGFWSAGFANIDPALLTALARRIEELDRQTRAEIGAFTEPRPPEIAERPGLHPDGRLDVTAAAMFGDPEAQAAPNGLIFASVGRLLNGAHSLISGWLHEQVSMAQIGQDSYVIGINGLSPENMTVSPNGVFAVLLTAYGRNREANAYYRYVRERFVAYIEQIPPNSTLHLAGHSMGGGMIFMLLEDPEMQDLLLARGITLASVTTLGAVRPTNPAADAIPPPNLRAEAARLFDGTEIRHYVDSDDSLARNVGAGHAGYANVTMLDNGVIDDPVAAHTDYGDAVFQDLPPDLQVLPFAVDPAFSRLFPRVPPPPPPPPPIEEPPTIILAA